MTSQGPPRIVLLASAWSQRNHPFPESPWSLEQRLAAAKDAGFDAYCCPPENGLKDLLGKYRLRYAGAFDASDPSQFEERIQSRLAVGDGPINCQLADHDTPPKEAVELALQLFETASKLGAAVHLEVHRDTCTETPEKTAAIIEGCRKRTGTLPLVNFDFSHPAIIKHLNPGNYIDRLFEGCVEAFQQSRLWHMRPFNGHHCQVPVTDGNGAFSPEYEDLRPFIRAAFSHWLAGPRPGNELWVLPELGPMGGYGLSCFPPIWEDTVVLGRDLRALWNEALQS